MSILDSDWTALPGRVIAAAPVAAGSDEPVTLGGVMAGIFGRRR
jgi:hypothetical protein